MSENMVQPKGILKKNSTNGKKGLGVKWNEENVAATFHPANKDYGHMKIDEPQTPFESGSEFDEDSQGSLAFTPEELSQKLEETMEKMHTSDQPPKEVDPENKHKSEFEKRRKEHYKEYFDIKKARMLIEQELKEIESPEK